MTAAPRESWKSGPALGYFVLRFALGVNMAIHGAVRLFGNYHGFVTWMVDTFQVTILPVFFLRGFGYAIPVFELAIGLLLIFGFYTRTSLVAGGLFMASLVFGMGLLENWSTVANQMIYVLVFYFLLNKLVHNRISIDYWFLNRLIP